MRKQSLQALRQAMLENHIDFYLVLHSDPHLSEYFPTHYESREWLSGFSGSAGHLIVGLDEAYLFTDGRYWVQAQKELEGSGITLEKQTKTHTLISWLQSNLLPHQTLGADFQVLPFWMHQDLHKKLPQLKFVNCDLISPLWKDRPALPCNPVFLHPQEFAGLSPKEKLSLIASSLVASKISHHLITALEDIAWALNLRGSDIAYNPLFLAYLLVDCEGQATLFVDSKKVSSEIVAFLQSNGVQVQEEKSLLNSLQDLPSLWLDPQKSTAGLVTSLSPQTKLYFQTNPSTLLKAKKTSEELSHIRNAMEQDGVAMCEFLYQLEKKLAEGEKLDELQIDSMLQELRTQRKHYVSESFATIAGFNQNGALPHYRATKEAFSTIDGDGLLLVDSGAHYLNGTTDLTRTIPVGELKLEQKRDYTLVLKAHIAMAVAIFPQGIAMPMLDSITRAPMWENGLDYAHGTGHGVGYFLNVHEGPQVLSVLASNFKHQEACEGMILSIEPGVYRPNQWGVRLENLVAIQKAPFKSEFGEFLCFESLTLCPFEKECILVELLTQKEKDFLNQYHQMVYERLSPLIQAELVPWLREKTQAIL